MSNNVVMNETEVSLEFLRSVVLQDSRYTCFFRLRERTRSEYVAVGLDGNILRWSATGGDEQKWVIMPADVEGYCKIFTVQNGECMAVGLNGNILRWADTHGPEQLFRFVNFRASDRSCNIQEKRDRQFVAVGLDGNVLRWSATGGEEQRFILEAVELRVPDPEKVKRLVAQRPIFDPARIPQYPVIPAPQIGPREPAQDFLIGIEVLPSVFVNDPRYTNKVLQVREQPYYYLVRTRGWKKFEDRLFQAGQKRTHTTSVHRGSSQHDIKSVETTVGVVVGAKVSGEIGRTPGEEGGVGGKVAAELSAQYSWQKRELEQHESTKEEFIEDTEAIEFTPEHECRVVLWQAVEKYSLFDDNLMAVGNPWTVYTDNTEWDVSPKGTAYMVKPPPQRSF